ncbi:hypothetical protein CSW98_02635 [Vibrio sp. HA2012]|uniref:glycosyltransferase family 2 protein n=1 Tax=Vibrio sp. HA2012 TaxID=1971595 RepID=UPI000C2C58E2|nr:glycosyltransferase family 2 protein [Vibrio sp. HA2012]PJC88034.1 hypothetical protein CSW98_02635 [Vibrio sp. HA2012]
MIASIIIPTYGRSKLLERAIESVYSCDGSKDVEVIIVDDCSPVPVRCSSLRENDRIIRLKSNSGAAVARNVGINSARGDLIYLLDSDDYIVERNFIKDYDNYKGQKKLFYSNIKSQGYKSDFPNSISASNYFESIFFKYPHICQTSSLFFDRSLRHILNFDESLPKHQDWDLILFSALNNNIQVEKGDGVTFFDRSDRGSLSRKYSGYKSEPWFDKICKLSISTNMDIDTIKYCLFGQYITHYRWKSFFLESASLFLNRNLKAKILFVKLVHRLIQEFNKIKISG